MVVTTERSYVIGRQLAIDNPILPVTDLRNEFILADYLRNPTDLNFVYETIIDILEKKGKIAGTYEDKYEEPTEQLKHFASRHNILAKSFNSYSRQLADALDRNDSSNVDFYSTNLIDILSQYDTLADTTKNQLASTAFISMLHDLSNQFSIGGTAHNDVESRDYVIETIETLSHEGLLKPFEDFTQGSPDHAKYIDLGGDPTHVENAGKVYRELCQDYRSAWETKDLNALAQVWTKYTEFVRSEAERHRVSLN